jgi:ribosome-associated protein
MRRQGFSNILERAAQSMFEITPFLQIPDDEFTWTYARSGGPGGQNVNKVASKAVLRWNIAECMSVPEEVKIRLALQQKRFFTQDGSLIIMSQRYRDQERNRDDCLEKLRAIILQALEVPKARKKTRPSRGAKRRRLHEKKRRSDVKQQRRRPPT